MPCCRIEDSSHCMRQMINSTWNPPGGGLLGIAFIVKWEIFPKSWGPGFLNDSLLQSQSPLMIQGWIYRECCLTYSKVVVDRFQKTHDGLYMIVISRSSQRRPWQESYMLKRDLHLWVCSEKPETNVGSSQNLVAGHLSPSAAEQFDFEGFLWSGSNCFLCLDRVHSPLSLLKTAFNLKWSGKYYCAFVATLLSLTKADKVHWPSLSDAITGVSSAFLLCIVLSLSICKKTLVVKWWHYWEKEHSGSTHLHNVSAWWVQWWQLHCVGWQAQLLHFSLLQRPCHSPVTFSKEKQFWRVWTLPTCSYHSFCSENSQVSQGKKVCAHLDLECLLCKSSKPIWTRPTWLNSEVFVMLGVLGTKTSCCSLWGHFMMRVLP